MRHPSFDARARCGACGRCSTRRRRSAAPRAREAVAAGRGSSPRTGSPRRAASSRSRTSTTRTRSQRLRGGRPFRGMEVRIADPETDAELPAGEIGQILVRGPGLFEGYHNDPEKTAEAMRGGWLHTGDLGVVDADGPRLVPRAHEGHAQGRRRERRGARDRGVPRLPPGREDRPGRRRARPEVPRGAGRVRRARAGRRARAPRSSSSGAAGRSRRSRCRATCASSTSGRCRRRRSRSSGSARRSSPSWRADAAPNHPRRHAARRLRRRRAAALARAPCRGLPPDAAPRGLRPEPPARGGVEAPRPPAGLLGNVVRRPRRRKGVVREPLLPRRRHARRTALPRPRDRLDGAYRRGAPGRRSPGLPRPGVRRKSPRRRRARVDRAPTPSRAVGSTTATRRSRSLAASTGTRSPPSRPSSGSRPAA